MTELDSDAKMEKAFAAWPQPLQGHAEALKLSCQNFWQFWLKINNKSLLMEELEANQIAGLWIWILRAGPDRCADTALNLYPLIRRPTRDPDFPSHDVREADSLVNDVRDALDTLRGHAAPPPRAVIQIDAIVDQIEQIKQSIDDAGSTLRQVKDTVQQDGKLGSVGLGLGPLQYSLDLAKAIAGAKKLIDILALDRLMKAAVSMGSALFRAAPTGLKRLLRLATTQARRGATASDAAAKYAGATSVLPMPPELPDDDGETSNSLHSMFPPLKHPHVPADRSTGEVLREYREYFGYELRMVHRETRIPERKLEAIEKMLPGELGAPVYAKGFIRTYARFLGLNPEHVLDLWITHAARKLPPG